MKKILISFFALITITNANAQHPNSTNYEFYYNGNLVETTGNYFLSELLILPRSDMYQTPRKGIVDTFRNVFTAYETKQTKWLNQYTQGTKKAKKDLTKKFLHAFRQDELFYMQGYALFNKYAIIFLEHKVKDEKLLFIMEKHSKFNYVPSANFQTLYPMQYKTILEAYKGNGEFKIVKAK